MKHMDVCRYMMRIVTEGTWWCEKWEDQNPIHVECDCDNCPDFDSIDNVKRNYSEADLD